MIGSNFVSRYIVEGCSTSVTFSHDFPIFTLHACIQYQGCFIVCVGFMCSLPWTFHCNNWCFMFGSSNITLLFLCVQVPFLGRWLWTRVTCCCYFSTKLLEDGNILCRKNTKTQRIIVQYVLKKFPMTTKPPPLTTTMIASKATRFRRGGEGEGGWGGYESNVHWAQSPSPPETVQMQELTKCKCHGDIFLS